MRCHGEVPARSDMAVPPKSPVRLLGRQQTTRSGNWRSWDVVVLGLAVHGAILLALGTVDHPAWAFVVIVCFVAWRIAFAWLERRRASPKLATLELINGAGSLVLAALLLASDGGTESPFFFWMVIILAWHALVDSGTGFPSLALVGLISYELVVLLIPDMTVASVARLGLFALFCAVLQVGRDRFHNQERRTGELTGMIADMWQTAPAGLFMFGDNPLRLLYTNDIAQAMALTDDEIEGLGEIAERTRQRGRQAKPSLLTLMRPEGPARHLRVTAAPHPMETDSLVVVSAEDVSPQVAIGEERRRFLQMASHQLRTPLTPIVAYAELLAAGKLQGRDVQEASETILASAQRLDRLFSRMADVVRLQHEPTRAVTTASIQAVLDHVDAIDRGLLRSVEISGNRQETIECDPWTLASALFELLDNGRRFGQPPIALSWSKNGKFVELRVTDAGPGPENTEDLFTHWGEHRSPDVVPKGMGTVLGLQHARLLTSLIGGEIEFQRGSPSWAFVLSFPVSTHHRTDGPRPSAFDEQDPVFLTSRRSRSIGATPQSSPSSSPRGGSSS